METFSAVLLVLIAIIVAEQFVAGTAGAWFRAKFLGQAAA